mmetsp:Transcript_58097/g.169861  ORF Transcript_58097/g.169861 Transcript_58097/m.169861 type:complete len:222 (+) Transcript_58097:73-738(+)
MFRSVVAPLVLLLGFHIASCETDAIAMIQHSVKNDMAMEASTNVEEASAEDEESAEASLDEEEEEDEEEDPTANYVLRLKLSSAHIDVRSKEQRLEAGDKAMLNVVKCHPEGEWVESHITGKGNTPETWNIKIMANPEDQEYGANTPAKHLRAVGPGKKNQFKVGQKVEALVSRCLGADEWVPCVIEQIDEQSNMYKVKISNGADHWQSIPGVPGRALKKA